MYSLKDLLNKGQKADAVLLYMNMPSSINELNHEEKENFLKLLIGNI